MRGIGVLSGSAALFAASSAPAADALKFGPPPAWVRQQTIPVAKPSLAPVAMLLDDAQIAFERGKSTTYTEAVAKIQNAQGLAAGNLSIVWEPATETVTVNKLVVRRGDAVIDVLASGQKFTVLRRETNLDAATLDGTLTANIQPEGLQEGDVIDFATTVERSDPVLTGHVEAMFAGWGGLPIERAHAVLTWPKDLRVAVRQTPNLPAAQRALLNGMNVLELSATQVQPLVPPKGAPKRFQIGRLAEASNFETWNDLATLLSPLFRTASTIPATGPLRTEVDKIRSSSTDPRTRASLTLALVQDRIRYVALLMGQGGYVPASAEETWSRRFGDCKAKTALLIGILHELGIEAEPVVVQSDVGDMVADRLPMIGLFNHVLARVHIDGKVYWLDGTRTGDAVLDAIQTPDFGWGLPLEQNARLVRITPAPLTEPSGETIVEIDATAGVRAPAPTKIEMVFRGDTAVIFQTGLSGLADAQRQEFFRSYFKQSYDDVTMTSTTYAFDKTKRELHLVMRGEAKLDWSSGYYHVANSTVGYSPDFARPAGPFQDAPFDVGFPVFSRTTTRIRFPRSFLGRRPLGSAAVHETLAGIEYARSSSVEGDTVIVTTSERSVVPEISIKEARAAEARLRALADEDVALPLSRSYRETPADLAAMSKEQPGSARAFVERGNAYLDSGKLDQSISDFTEALKLEPRDIWALADRALAYLYKKNLDAAAKDITAAEAIDPRNAVLWRAKAVRAETQHDAKSAYDFYTRSLEAEPGNWFALLRRALVSMGQNKPTDALRDVNAVLSGSSENASMLALRALVYAGMGKTDEARKDIAAARAIDPSATGIGAAETALAQQDNDYKTQVMTFSNLLAANRQDPTALISRGQAYFKLERYAEALADTAEALKLGYHEPDVRVLRANVFMMRKDREAVAREAEAMVRENPDSDYAFVAAGKTYDALGRKQDAMKAFDQALAIKPEAYIYVNRAQVRPYADSVGRLADLDAAIKLDPDNTDALAIKAEELVRAKNFTGALALYDRVAALLPQDKDLPLQRASALFKAGRTAEAEKIFTNQRVAAKTPQDFNSLCGTQAWLGGALLKSARQDCDAALKLQARFSAAIGNVALIELRMGQYDAAITHYAEAIGNKPSAAYYFGRAVAYSRKGDSARAQADRTEALKLDADEEAQFAEVGVKL